MNLGGSVKINKCGIIILTLFFVLVLFYLSYGRAGKKPPNNNGYVKNSNEINLRKLLIGSIQAAIVGGSEVLAVSKEIDLHKKSKGQTKEGADDPVTDADLRSHCAMQYGLQRIFPKLTIVSEEDATETKCPSVNAIELDPTVLHNSITLPDENVNIDDITVWIDPLDATQEYTEQLNEYVTTMVCVAVKGKPIIGVIHNPFTKKTSWAWAGKSLKSTDLAAVRIDESTKNPIFIISRSHSGDVKKTIQRIYGDKTNVISAGGAGYKVLQVVFNNASAYIHTTNIKKWDICAGNAILNALGGRMTGLLGEEINYNSGENNVLHEKGLLATLSNHDFYVKKYISHATNGQPSKR